MFITFEGIDGSGKSTQIKLLRKKLELGGQQVEVFREPGGTELSERVRELLLNAELNIDPVAELFLFSAARAQLVVERIIPSLNEGKVVILDRFYDSTTAYQGYGRASASLDQIRLLNRLASQQQKPDLTFYLKIDREESKNRISDQLKDRMERSGDHFFDKVIGGFDKIAESEKRIVPVDATLPVKQVHQKIWTHVVSALDKN